MRKAAIILAAILGLLGLSACGLLDDPHYEKVETPDGTVDCVVTSDSERAGISCNWGAQ